jgi:hypothetical protein
MDNAHFDALARRASVTQVRRRSLKALGAAALVAALTVPASTMITPRAAAKGKKKRPNKCKQLAGQCTGFIADFCAQEECKPEFETAARACCTTFTTCDVAALLSCLFAEIT